MYTCCASKSIINYVKEKIHSQYTIHQTISASPISFVLISTQGRIDEVPWFSLNHIEKYDKRS